MVESNWIKVRCHHAIIDRLKYCRLCTGVQRGWPWSAGPLSKCTNSLRLSFYDESDDTTRRRSICLLVTRPRRSWKRFIYVTSIFLDRNSQRPQSRSSPYLPGNGKWAAIEKLSFCFMNFSEDAGRFKNVTFSAVPATRFRVVRPDRGKTDAGSYLSKKSCISVWLTEKRTRHFELSCALVQ